MSTWRTIDSFLSNITYLEPSFYERDKQGCSLPFENLDPHSVFRNDNVPRIPEHDGGPINEKNKGITKMAVMVWENLLVRLCMYV